MSAVAPTAEYAAKPALEVVVPSPAVAAEQEMYRWMLWFGLPSLVAAVFVGAAFATNVIWYIGGAICAVIGAIGMLIWLAMSSCTNTN